MKTRRDLAMRNNKKHPQPASASLDGDNRRRRALKEHRPHPGGRSYGLERKYAARQPLDHHVAGHRGPDRFADANGTASSILA
ncbi:MAG: hypothetical protein ABGZ53_00550 [Fuerstiella sp.]